jgi:glycosyltransferase involved in cell wall biosynthesis
MHPRASVVIPVFNRAGRVLPALQSVQSQTFRDFECIVVDDGSADGEALRRVVEGLGDERFRYVRRDNGGGGAARNSGIDEAKGEIVAFLDSDDRWLPEKLERDVEAGAGRRVVFSPVLVERRGRIVGRRPSTAPRAGERISEYLACRDGFTQTSTMAMPAGLARQVRFDEAIPFGQDTDFAIRLAAAGAEFHMIAEPAVVMLDDETGDRVSRSSDWQEVLAWADRRRTTLGERAYHAFRGWHVARMAAESGDYMIALGCYGAALSSGAFSPRLAVKAFGQILIPRSIYSRLR